MRRESYDIAIYRLPDDATDDQALHVEDEIGYDPSGRPKIDIGGERYPVEPGDEFIVERVDEHRFVHIEETFETLGGFASTVRSLEVT